MQNDVSHFPVEPRGQGDRDAVRSKSLETLPVGTAYAVWTGIGAVGTVILGIFLFGESRDLLRILCLLCIISGIVGLKMVSVD